MTEDTSGLPQHKSHTVQECAATENQRVQRTECTAAILSLGELSGTGGKMESGHHFGLC